MIDGTPFHRGALGAALFGGAMLVLTAGAGHAEDAQQQPFQPQPPGTASAEQAPATPQRMAKPQQLTELTSEEEVKKFCTNIADAAKDRRYLLQKQELAKLQADINARITIMEKRKAEYEDWLKRRNDFLAQTEANLINVYKTMKADAAAPQMEQLNPEIAASIIMKLPARQSGLILSEMDPRKAAMVAAVMTSAADPKTSKDPS